MKSEIMCLKLVWIYLQKLDMEMRISRWTNGGFLMLRISSARLMIQRLLKSPVTGSNMFLRIVYLFKISVVEFNKGLFGITVTVKVSLLQSTLKDYTMIYNILKLGSAKCTFWVNKHKKSAKGKGIFCLLFPQRILYVYRRCYNGKKSISHKVLKVKIVQFFYFHFTYRHTF